MESTLPSNILTNQVPKNSKYKDVSFLGKKTNRSPNILKYEAMKTKEHIDNKWKKFDEALKLILDGFEGNITHNHIKKMNDWNNSIDKNLNLIDKRTITVDTKIDENTALDIILSEIKSLFTNNLCQRHENFRKFCSKKINPIFMTLKEINSYVGGLRKLLEPLFSEPYDEKKELLKILKIDYFQKCFNDLEFNEKTLLNIMFLKETDITIYDLNRIYLPFNINKEKLLSYGEFLKMIMNSNTYLQAIKIVIESQSKDTNYEINEIKKYVNEIIDAIIYPIVFPNSEELYTLYGLTCINLRIYLSSFMIENIDDTIDSIEKYYSLSTDVEKIEILKSDILIDIKVGFNFCCLFMTILHESAHLIKRHVAQPCVYIDTDEIKIEKEIGKKGIFLY
jgi:hypothetical protein